MKMCIRIIRVYCLKSSLKENFITLRNFLRVMCWPNKLKRNITYEAPICSNHLKSQKFVQRLEMAFSIINSWRWSSSTCASSSTVATGSLRILQRKPIRWTWTNGWSSVNNLTLVKSSTRKTWFRPIIMRPSSVLLWPWNSSWWLFLYWRRNICRSFMKVMILWMMFWE